MRKHIIDRDILPVFRNHLLTEIQAEGLRALCNKVKERGAPATAVRIRDIVKQVYVHAIAHGEKVDNPADSMAAASIATFVPTDGALSLQEARMLWWSVWAKPVATMPWSASGSQGGWHWSSTVRLRMQTRPCAARWRMCAAPCRQLN